MSFQAMTWAVNQDLKTNEKMVLIMLANRANSDTGRCDPSHKRLAKDCGMSKATVKRCIDKLEGMGFLRVIGRSVEGVNLANQYDLNFNTGVQTIFPTGYDKSKSVRGGVTLNTRRSKTAGNRLTDNLSPIQPEPTGGFTENPQWGHCELENNKSISNVNQEVNLTISATQNFAAPEGENHSKLDDAETALQRKCQEAWRAYSKAYFQRYKAQPVRNSKVNSAVKQLVQRLGSDAPSVAAYFVNAVNEQFILTNMHGINLLLKNAEGYHTQWVTGRSVTRGQARQLDSTQTNLNCRDDALRMMREKREREAAGQ